MCVRARERESEGGRRLFFLTSIEQLSKSVWGSGIASAEILQRQPSVRLLAFFPSLASTQLTPRFSSSSSAAASSLYCRAFSLLLASVFFISFPPFYPRPCTRGWLEIVAVLLLVRFFSLFFIRMLPLPACMKKVKGVAWGRRGLAAGVKCPSERVRLIGLRLPSINARLWRCPLDHLSLCLSSPSLDSSLCSWRLLPLSRSPPLALSSSLSLHRSLSPSSSGSSSRSTILEHTSRA